ncbi:MAG: phospholipase D-like domain-containing protein [Polyangiaceae bacterium]|nr:phospholipase D-like domain-containing protein [Polyangiaceae bacterium]
MSKAPSKPQRDTEFVLRQSRPLSSLVDAAQEFSSKCDELWVATAFVDELAVKHVIEPAVAADAKVRFLTGTFGHVTRHRTFARLERLVRKGAIAARVWEGEFHIKLFIWRFGARVVAWIGSANLTAGGLQREGELVLQLKGMWAETRHKRIRSSFEREWERSRNLDASFLANYKESPRSGWLLDEASSKPSAGRQLPRIARQGRCLVVVPVARHYEDDSSVVARIAALLGGTAKTWYRGSARALASVKRGHPCLVVDYIDKDVVVGVVTDTKPDGRGHVFAYEQLVRSPRPLAALKKKHAGIELGPATRRVRTQWLDRDSARLVIAEIFGTRVAARALGPEK